VSESPHRISPGGTLIEGEEKSIAGAWNAVLTGVPLMHHWTVEQFMARVSNIGRIDLGWRNDLREQYDV